MMKCLPVGRKGAVSVVDDDVFEWASKHRWYRTGRGSAYAARHDGGRRVLLHREIMGVADTRVPLVDHINGDTLDNRRENLRLATRSESEQNKAGASARSQTGVRNVWWNPRRGLYESYIMVNGKSIYAGRSKSLEACAAKAAEARAKHMPFSRESLRTG